jgi:tRNA threonylcarbamoyladenosine biosynthesis protein TsaE
VSSSPTVLLASADDTRAFGFALGAIAPPGAWVLLAGELGTGKTTLVGGVAAGMGLAERVTSPTFVLVHEHPSPDGPGLIHADLYRVRNDRDAEALALFEYADDGWVVAVEWPERWPALGAVDALSLVLREAADGTRRAEVVRTTAWAAPVLEQWDA